MNEDHDEKSLVSLFGGGVSVGTRGLNHAEVAVEILLKF
jgi:hypothetical protein